MLSLRHCLPHCYSSQPQVFVYRGEGAGWRSVCSTTESLQRLLPSCYQVSTLTAAELLAGTWAEQAALLVIPGGADLPYCKHLNGRGNALIKRFVQSGGSYLGLCAGAYYAASRVEFEPGSTLEVVGKRELSFFPGVARGAAYAGFDYQTEAGSVAAQVQFAVPPALAPLHLQQPQQQQHQQHGPNSNDTRTNWLCTHDYCNGGPVFVTRNGHSDVGQLPGVTVLAHYLDLPNRADIWQVQQNLQHQDSSKCTHNKPHRREAEQPVGVQHAAAVRCEVGAGVAVLCGTHPELHPQWLDACGYSKERCSPARSVIAAESQPADAAAPYVAAGGDVPATANVIAAAIPHSCTVQQIGAATAVTSSSNGRMLSNDSCSEDDKSPHCGDSQLACHTEALRRTLAASQQQRDLFLSCLLYEVLRRP